MALQGQGWTILDHAGDALLEVEAAELEGVFSLAATALRTLICPDFSDSPTGTRTLSLEGPDLEGLLVAWINELLYLFETQNLLWADARVRLSEDQRRLEASLPVAGFDPARHPVEAVVKSATHHRLRVARETDGLWRTRVVLDL